MMGQNFKKLILLGTDPTDFNISPKDMKKNIKSRFGMFIKRRAIDALRKIMTQKKNLVHDEDSMNETEYSERSDVDDSDELLRITDGIKNYIRKNSKPYRAKSSKGKVILIPLQQIQVEVLIKRLLDDDSKKVSYKRDVFPIVYKYVLKKYKIKLKIELTGSHWKKLKDSVGVFFKKELGVDTSRALGKRFSFEVAVGTALFRRYIAHYILGEQSLIPKYTVSSSHIDLDSLISRRR